jgi:capsular polysaccharide transport system permease protein
MSTLPSPSLRRSLQIQCRVIWALVQREIITRFGRKNLGALWLLGEPAMFTAGVAAMWYGLDLHHSSSVSVFAFAVTGYSSVLVWRNTVSRCNTGIESNRALLYHRNVRIIDVFASRILIEIGGVAGSFMTLSTVFIATDLMPFPDDGLKVAAAFLLLAWFGAALGILIGSATAYSEIVDRLWHPITYLSFPVSGAAFMVDWLPPAAQQTMLWVPMVNGVEMLRDGFLGSTVRTYYDVGYLAMVNLVLTLLGLAVQRSVSRKM